MKHVFRKIPGFCEGDIFELYKSMVEKAKNGSRFVEVGSFLGRSTSLMIVEIINNKKEIQFDCVDIWRKKKTYMPSQEHSLWESLNEDFFDVFKDNLTKYGLLDYVNPIRSCSIEASSLYEDDSLDFIFLDSDHEYTHVLEEIKLWYNKVKKGGTLAGHDYRKKGTDGVKKAVDKLFRGKFKKIGSCWMVTK